MNATGTPTGDPESCQLLAAGGHSRIIVLHYNHSGRLAGRAGAEEVGLGVLRGLFVAVSCLVVLEKAHVRSMKYGDCTGVTENVSWLIFATGGQRLTDITV